MSKYTTGEIAKLCGVSVRTVQYYDNRKILIPSELSEGGRRLYSDADLQKMHIICFLREAGLSIGSIGELFEEKEPGKVISLIIEQQEQALREEVKEQQKKLDMLSQIRKELRGIENFSVESIGDIAYSMKNKNKLWRLRALMVLTGIPVTALQWTSIVLWIAKGIWWPFVLWVCVAIPWGTWVSIFYFKKVDYICPECHTVFKPRLKQAFFANHTPTTRKLTCPHCSHKGFCVEVYTKEENTEE